ncbi:MAG: hypothetical protein ABEI99_07550 [Halobaculum sp.]
MPTGTERLRERLSVGDDPRLTDEFWRLVPGDDDDGGGTAGDVVLVGVVHDHPASVHRVRAVAEAFEPDTLGLELPPLAVPSEGKLASGGSADRLGESTDRPDESAGEMSAAVAAAPEADVVGIDPVGPRFLRRLARNVWSDDVSLATIRHTLGNVVGIARFALRARLDGWGSAARGSAAAHDVTGNDAPSMQADDERTCVARSRSLLGAFERPAADVLLDETREETMAARIESLRTDGSVLAVVGMDHLDSLAEQLSSGDTGQ